MRTFIQKLGKSMMGPLSIIVAAGLLLGITTILTNASLVGEAFASAAGVQVVVGATLQDTSKLPFKLIMRPMYPIDEI